MELPCAPRASDLDGGPTASCPWTGPLSSPCHTSSTCLPSLFFCLGAPASVIRDLFTTKRSASLFGRDSCKIYTRDLKSLDVAVSYRPPQQNSTRLMDANDCVWFGSFTSYWAGGSLTYTALTVFVLDQLRLPT